MVAGLTTLNKGFTSLGFNLPVCTNSSVTSLPCTWALLWANGFYCGPLWFTPTAALAKVEVKANAATALLKMIFFMVFTFIDCCFLIDVAIV